MPKTEPLRFGDILRWNSKRSGDGQMAMFIAPDKYENIPTFRGLVLVAGPQSRVGYIGDTYGPINADDGFGTWTLFDNCEVGDTD